MFTLTERYALRAMCFMASRPGDMVPTAILARHAGVRQTYLTKVLQRLAHASLIEARRGIGGGVRLARPARDIRLADVVRALEDPSRRRRSADGSAGGAAMLRPLHTLLDEISDSMIARLDSATLADLVPNGTAPETARRMNAPLEVAAGATTRASV